MVQRLLTKYSLTFHLVCLGLMPLFLDFQEPQTYVWPLLWLLFIVLEWMWLLPVVYRGENLATARQRVGDGIWRDPFCYFFLLFIFFLTLQTLNSGCELEYLDEIENWRMSRPPVSWLPFSIESVASRMYLVQSIVVFCMVVALRHAVGRGGKRVLLQWWSALSGLSAVILVALNWSNISEPAVGALATIFNAYATYFGFWLLLGMGVFYEALRRRQKYLWILFAGGIVGNSVGLFFYAPLGQLVLYLFGALVVYLLCALFLDKKVRGRRRLIAFSLNLIALVFLLIFMRLLPQQSRVISVAEVNALPTTVQNATAQHGLRWQQAVNIWQHHPWRGSGADGFKHFAGLLFAPEMWQKVKHDRFMVCNDFLQALLEFGILGLALLLLAGITLFGTLLSRLRRLNHFLGSNKKKDGSVLRSTALILPTGLIALFFVTIESFIATSLFVPSMQLAWMAVLAVLPAFVPEKINE